MANLTLAPNPWFTGFDDDGNIVPGGLLFTYAAGSSTKKNTYTDVLGQVANTNPIVLDDAGRVPSGLFLLPSSYKFVLAPANDTDPPTNPIRTQDNIGAVPTTDIDNDVTGTAGQTMTAGQAAYLSDGSGALTAGRWYLADADNTYSSTGPEVAFVVSDVVAGATGTFRLSGRVTGLSGLTPGANYYVSATAGDITATAPLNGRFVGQADSITSLIATPNPPVTTSSLSPILSPFLKTQVQGRLSLTTGVPVTSGDVTAATTIYWVPYQGNQVALYTGSTWVSASQAQLSIAVPATTNQMYDVFMDYNAGVPALSLTAWTNDTTRATALTTQDGVLVKTGALTSRYLGSFRTTAVSGQTEDSVTNRLVWNYYNRIRRPMQRIDTTASWNYTSTTVRQANNSALNQFAIVVGVAEITVDIDLTVNASNSSAGQGIWVGIGINSTTTFSGTLAFVSSPVAGYLVPLHAHLTHQPAARYNVYSWNESNDAAGTVTYYGESAAAGSRIESGLSGWTEG